ncbi:phage tail tape measure protein [Chromobacterium violaceum]|uniref:Phage tail tape measure protein n=1 Tax=Chromobacterium violaceum TaxID=536 RepID=A0A202BDB6_CHRVL|nr:phage tail tape measure protein [Chromobacterium violaceum]OVE49459.1 phage tail tape measure protein [Chromobacterium violaceum]
MSNEQIGKGIIELEVREVGVTASIAKVDQALGGLEKTSEQATKAVESTGKSLANLKGAAQPAEVASSKVHQIGQGGDAAARKMEAATRSMINAIQRTTVSMEVGSKASSDYFRLLASQRGLDVAQLEPYLQQLDLVAARQKNAGISAGQLSNAMRMLPAQFTDIAVSLAGGQSPMMVFMQQGGQLKDMFGSTGEAAKAMGSYVMGLLNPLTISIGVAAAVSYEFYKLHEEIKAFNVALLATGNYAGMTEQGFISLAGRVADTGLVSQATAKSIATSFALSGKYGAENIDRFTLAVAQYAQVLNLSVKDAQSQLAQLFEDPVRAAKELDEQFHIMTYTDQAYIKELVEVGNKQEAVKFTLDRLTGQLQGPAAESLSWYTKLWHDLGSAIDSVHTFAQQKIQRDAAIDAIQKAMGPSQSLTHSQAREQAEAIYESDQRARASAAQRQAEATKRLALGKEQAAFLDKEHEKFRSRADERVEFANKIRAAETEAAAAAKGMTLTQLKAFNDKTIARYNEEHKDPEKRKASPFGKAEDREVADLRARIMAENQIAEAMGKNGAAYDKMTEGAKLALKFRYQEGVATTEAAKANLRLRASLADELGQRQELTAALKDRISVQKNLDEADQRRTGEMQLQREDMAKQLEFMTMSISQRERAQAQWTVEVETKRQLLDLQIKINQAKADEAAATTEAARAERKRIVEDLEAEQRLLGKDGARRAEAAVRAVDEKLALAGNWTVGAKVALADYADNAIRIGDEVGSAFSRAMGGMEDALTRFVTTGKLSFRDLANSIIEDMVRIQIRQSVTGPLSGFLSGMFGRSGPAAPIVDGTATGVGPLQAKGGAWLSGAQLFATGAAFTNSIVSRPTAFAHAAGLGVMGEAGPEAIMPLTRDGSGRLGVRSAGGGAPSVDVQVNVINQSSQPLQSQQQGQPRFDQFGNVIVDLIVTDMRRGGPISTTMERAYGLRRGG